MNVVFVVQVVNNFRSVVSQSEEPVIAVREFEDWSDTEFRTWWVNGSLVRVEFHSDVFLILMNAWSFCGMVAFWFLLGGDHFLFDLWCWFVWCII